MTDLLQEPNLAHRLLEQTVTYENRVRDTLLACRTGEQGSTDTMRACGMELHSLKGAASLLELTELFRAVGGLSETMMSRSIEPPESFWNDFERWFGLLVRQLRSHCQQGRHIDLDKLLSMREELERALGAAPSSSVFVPSSRPEQRPSFSPSVGRRLLVIEDSPTVRAALAARLGQRGYPVECADDMVTVAQKLRDFDPEVVVCDVHMPGIEGDEVCRKIKSHMRRLVPVILYSSMDAEALGERARRARADGFVCKSAGIEALIARMDELLGEEILF